MKKKLSIAFALASAVSVFGAPSLASAEEKAGPFMANLKIGAAIKADDFSSQFALSPEFGIALDRDKNFYLGVNPEFQFGDNFTLLNFPVFAQYDIELPVEGLYLYPKVSAGLAYAVQGDIAFFKLEPMFGVKYQVSKNFHVGGEPIGVAIYLGRIVGVQIHLYASAGLDF